MASNTEAEGEVWNRSALTASEEAAPALTVISDLQPPEPCDNTFLLFSSHSLAVWLKLIQVGAGGKVSENTLTALRLCHSQKGAVLVAKVGCGARVGQ